MIAMEILIFLLGLLVGKKRERKGVRDNSEHKTIEELGVVRGLSFFYSSFRYMSVAFMSIVLAIDPYSFSAVRYRMRYL